MLLEQQKWKRLLMARQEQDSINPSSDQKSKQRDTTPLPSVPSTPLEDYQMSLKLLEQQKKKRLLMELQEQDSINPSPN